MVKWQQQQWKKSDGRKMYRVSDQSLAGEKERSLFSTDNRLGWGSSKIRRWAVMNCREKGQEEGEWCRKLMHDHSVKWNWKTIKEKEQVIFLHLEKWNNGNFEETMYSFFILLDLQSCRMLQSTNDGILPLHNVVSKNSGHIFQFLSEIWWKHCPLWWITGQTWTHACVDHTHTP